MTEKVHLSFNRTIRSREVAAAIQYGGGTEGWIAPSDQRLVEDSEGELATGPLGAFNYVSSSGMDVTIDTGEALVEGAYVVSDAQHTVTLDASTTGQTVYVGWQDGAADTVIVGLDSAFTVDDHRLPAWTFDTDGSDVTSVTDERSMAPSDVVVSETEPTYAKGRLWLNPETGVLSVAHSGYYQSVPPVQVRQEAATFTEAEVSVSHTGTRVQSGSIELSPTFGSTATRPSDDNVITDPSSDRWGGLRLNPNVDIIGVQAVISANTINIPEVRLFDTSGNVIASATGDFSAGDFVELEANIASGTDFFIGAGHDSSSEEGDLTSPSYPYSSSDIDITGGDYDVSDGAAGTSFLRAFNDVTAVLSGSNTTGDAIVSFADVRDLESWDLATFQRTLDDEEVTIDIEDENGNVLFSDISQNFDISTVVNSTNPRFHVYLSRNDTSNNPTVDYLARRFVR